MTDSIADHGAFSGEPKAIWLSTGGAPDRDMQLIEAFWFRDQMSVEWLAPEGSVVNGASIPKALWSSVGSPYTGDYRRASIVHDLACIDAQGDSGKRRAADRMFYHACRAGGCSTLEATILYVGVRIGAHQNSVAAWRSDAPELARPQIYRTLSAKRIEAAFQLTAELVLAGGEIDDAEEIERRTDEALSTVAGFDLRNR